MLNKLHTFVFGLICSLSIISHLNAEITEIAEIKSVKNSIKDNSLVFLNVGDTLFSPSSMLADNQWREYFVERTNQLISEPVAAQRVIDKVKGLIVEKVPKVTPEEATPEFIAQLQNEEIPVYGYTQRNFSTSYAKNNGFITSNHLLKMGIDLNKSLSYDSIQEYHNASHDFQYGILFSNKNLPGPAIVEFITSRGENPSIVIVVDDSLKTLEEIGSALATAGIDYQGLRYGRIDSRKNAFDPQIGTIQFFAFINENRLLTDSEAMQIRDENPETDYQAELYSWILNY